MKTIKRQYDNPKHDRLNRYCERRLERLSQLEKRGYEIRGPRLALLWFVWVFFGSMLVRTGLVVTPQVYYPVVRGMRAYRH